MPDAVLEPYLDSARLRLEKQAPVVQKAGRPGGFADVAVHTLADLDKDWV
jgi:hypothetical protein